jgi:hypothetical protein
MLHHWHSAGEKFLRACFSFFSLSCELLIALFSQEGFWAANRQLADL